MLKKEVKEYLSKIGKKGGKKKSETKTISNKINAMKRWKQYKDYDKIMKEYDN